MEKVINKKVVSRFLFCVIMTAFVLSETEASRCSGVSIKPLSAVHLTGTGTPPESLTHGQ